MFVQNMISKRSRRPVANQFIIRTGNATYFQSYRTTVCKITTDNVFLDENFWDYSKTTRKYRNQFLGETRKETMKKIKSGEYKLVNLN